MNKWILTMTMTLACATAFASPDYSKQDGQVGALIAPAAGVYFASINGNSPTTYLVVSSSATPGFITGVARDHQGASTLTFASGLFTNPPVCTVSAVEGTPGRGCTVGGTSGSLPPSAGSVQITCGNSAGFLDTSYQIICVGY